MQQRKPKRERERERWREKIRNFRLGLSFLFLLYSSRFISSSLPFTGTTSAITYPRFYLLNVCTFFSFHSFFRFLRCFAYGCEPHEYRVKLLSPNDLEPSVFSLSLPPPLSSCLSRIALASEKAVQEPQKYTGI